jgi:riboflavin kinase/FMN adenylyltransferase
VTNVGLRPTVEDTDCVNMETHIIGYNGNLYGSGVRVNFYKFIRDEVKFSSIEELKQEINKNIEMAKEYFR